MILYISVCAAVIILTRFLSDWGINSLKINDIVLIKDVLYFSYVENRGAAFGILQDSKVFLVIVALALFSGITYYIARHKDIKMSLLLPLSLIAGGGISNVLDRLTFGFVVDYIDFRIIHFPVFNLADICVVCGTILLAYYILFIEGKKNQS